MSNDLAAQIARLKAKQQQLEARARETARRRATHAHIVAGALLLTQPATFGLDEASVRAALDLVVRRPHDRHALGLPAVDATA